MIYNSVLTNTNRSFVMNKLNRFSTAAVYLMFGALISLRCSPALAADGITPYAGIEAQVRKMELKDSKTKKQSKIHPQLGLIAGVRGTSFGVEGGLFGSEKKGKNSTY